MKIKKHILLTDKTKRKDEKNETFKHLHRLVASAKGRDFQVARTSDAVASVSGTILAVWSCTILPLFAGIHRMGAGLGPACAFLYSGPTINVLEIMMTARILGPELSIARAFGAVSLSIVIGFAHGVHFS